MEKKANTIGAALESINAKPGTKLSDAEKAENARKRAVGILDAAFPNKPQRAAADAFVTEEKAHATVRTTHAERCNALVADMFPGTTGIALLSSKKRTDIIIVQSVGKALQILTDGRERGHARNAFNAAIKAYAGLETMPSAASGKGFSADRVARGMLTKRDDIAEAIKKLTKHKSVNADTLAMFNKAFAEFSVALAKLRKAI